jgi:hypothetical protein
MKKTKRARATRREADRSAKKDRETIAKLYALEAGGAADRPIEVASASEVEPDAARRRCPFCGGEARVTEHEVTEHAGRRLRVASLVCKLCHSAFRRYYALGPLLS